ncbi:MULTISPECIES: hypothetical protein [Streptomyces]|uniref:hypothetical protein n=1 Tax=Streptomyces TaxID=1883 RepID=UPI0019D03061|nr:MULTISPECIES: hypothetical protein [Streptomyces]MCX4466187.1 hypothetical protein [Streptomyces albidoflavus]WQG73257.1 hypothetical protein SR864_19805 [Streptomyces albidoflavus]WSI92441.1 hypothetical protein OG695_11410 [Streptomyces albidoflavus]
MEDEQPGRQPAEDPEERQVIQEGKREEGHHRRAAQDDGQVDQEGAQRSGVRVPLPRSEVDSPLGGTDVVSVGRGLRLDGRRQVC